MTNILFVCKYNKFRSKVAESYFEKMNRNKKIHVQSAGLIKGFYYPGEHSRVESFARKFGLKIKKPTQPLSERLFDWVDIIVDVANDVPFVAFSQAVKKGKKVIYWNIRDGHESQDLDPIIKRIMSKVDGFVKNL